MNPTELKELCEQDLYFLTKNILGYDQLEEEPHLEICELLEGSEPKKLLLLPRGSFKTTIGTIARCIQEIIKNPDIRILIFSETYNQAKKFLSEIKQQLTQNKELIGLYGSFVRDPGWKEEEITVRQRTKRFKEPTIMTGGVDVVRVGFHYDLIIVDDPHSQKNIATKDQIEKVRMAYGLLFPMLEPGGELNFIGTRWHFYDLASTLLEDSTFKTIIKAATTEKSDGTTEYFFPQRLSKEYLKERRDVLGGYLYSCFPQETPILMSNWEEKLIKDIKVGDEVVGWKKKKGRTGKPRNRLTSTKVLAIGKRKAPLIKVRLKSNRVVYCTPDHKWYKNPQGNREPWFYGVAKMGNEMMFISRAICPKLTVQENRDSAWLAGIYDGEGSGDKFIVRIAQSKERNSAICSEIERILDHFNFRYNYNLPAGVYWINGGLTERARFLSVFNPVSRDKILKTLFQFNFIYEKDEIIDIKQVQKEAIVYNIQTETANFIAYGYGSHNCQYQNNPVDDKDADFKKSWFKHYEEKSLEKLRIATYITIDPAVSEKETADYTGVIINSVDVDANWHIRRAMKLRIKPPDLIKRIFEWNEHWMPVRIGIEKEKYYQVIKPFLDEEMERRNEFPPVKELTPKVSNKEMRIRGLTPRYERGKIHHNKEDEGRIDLEDELLRFPKAQNDDVSDALSMQSDIAKPPDRGGVNYLQPKRGDKYKHIIRKSKV